MDLKLEVVVVPVSDVDRAKEFYKQRLGFREDIDYLRDDGYRVVQLTPPGSACSVIFGKGVTAAAPGSLDRLVLAVSSMADARDALHAKGVEVSVFHDAGGGLGAGFTADLAGRAAGPDPQGRSYATYASFSDPDGNRWLLQAEAAALVGHWRVDLIRWTIQWSDQAYRIHGVEPGTAMTVQRSLDLYIPADAARMRATLEQAVRPRAPVA